MRKIFTLLLLAIALFSAFFAIGLSFIGAEESSFFDQALLTKAEVTGITDEKYKDRDPVTKTYSQKMRKVVWVHFFTADSTIQQARKSDGKTTPYRAGDKVDIYYNPSDPSEIRFAKDSNSPYLIKEIRNGLAGIFFVSIGLLVFIKVIKPAKELEF